MMKKILSILLIAAIFATAVSIPVSAAESYRYIGDVDGDDAVSVIDATWIQKHLASLETLTNLQKFLGDVDNSHTTDILDATLIQKKLANLIVGFYRERIQSWKSEIYRIESTNTDSAYLLNTEYTFTLATSNYPIADEYRVLVDGNVVFDHSERKEFSYTFTEAGVHYIRTYCYGAWGNIDSCVMQLIVIDPNTKEKPQISTIDYDKATGRADVSASGGKAPYLYCYTIRQVPPPPPEYGPEYTAGAEFVFKTEPDGSYYLYCDFCDGIEVYVPTSLLSNNLYYQLEVQALDSAGALSEVKSIYIQK